jgi:L-rhamnose-H+ transport protein
MNQLVGAIFHLIGGFSSASFYVPNYKVKGWAWATYWVSLGFIAWVIMPTVGCLLVTNKFWAIFGVVPISSMVWTFVFGVLWGFGGLFAGLGLRYIGIALGQSISLGIASIVGTIVPPLINGNLGIILTSLSGEIISVGFLVSIIGVVFCGYAGNRKDKLLANERQKDAVTEFAAAKGISAAIIGGILSASMAIAIMYGKPIAGAALAHGTSEMFMNTPIFVFAFAGGFLTNFIYAMVTSFKNKAFGDFVARPGKRLIRNYSLAIASGLMWYLQFFFYGMGMAKMGSYPFVSWSLHMTSIIIFSNLWGLWLKEWALVDVLTKRYLWIGIILLILSVVLIGIGNNVATA